MLRCGLVGFRSGSIQMYIPSKCFCIVFYSSLTCRVLYFSRINCYFHALSLFGVHTKYICTRALVCVRASNCSQIRAGFNVCPVYISYILYLAYYIAITQALNFTELFLFMPKFVCLCAFPCCQSVCSCVCVCVPLLWILHSHILCALCQLSFWKEISTSGKHLVLQTMLNLLNFNFTLNFYFRA